MNTLIIAGAIMVVVGMGPAVSLQAQYKAPSQYFRKDSPGVPPRTPPPQGSQPGAPGAPGKTAPAVPAQPKFKDLPVNSQFYFMSDTNRTYTWTKISDTTGKNTKNGVTTVINRETPVQR